MMMMINDDDDYDDNLWQRFHDVISFSIPQYFRHAPETYGGKFKLYFKDYVSSHDVEATRQGLKPWDVLTSINQSINQSILKNII